MTVDENYQFKMDGKDCSGMELLFEVFGVDGVAHLVD